MKKIISLSAALMLCASMSGCGKNEESTSEAAASKYEGKWQCSEFSIDGESLDTVFGCKPSDLFLIELFDDNKGTFASVLFSESNEPEDIEWNLTDDEKIELTLISQEDSAEPFIFEYKEDKLVLDMSSDESTAFAYLTKVDEFVPIDGDLDISF